MRPADEKTMSEYIVTEKHGKVLLIRMVYEKTLNCCSPEMLDELRSLIRDFTRNPEYAALVLTGAGRAFCTGADLNEFTNLAPEACVDYAADFEEDIFHQLACCRKPTVAAVNGYAIGGGFEMALSCDFRIGHEKSSFSSPEYDFGWIPGWGGVRRLAAIVGPNKAKEIFFLKKKIRGPEAKELGILNELVEDPAELEAKAIEMATALAELNPLTVAYTKTVLDEFNVKPYDTLLQGLTNGITSKSPYARAKVEAFFNRKK